MSNSYSRGFTISELLIVIITIGILASISIVGFGQWRKNMAGTQIQNDLSNITSAINNHANFSGNFPTNLGSVYTPTDGVVLQFAVADEGEYCVNGYSIDYPEKRYSYDSKTDKIYEFPCVGITYGAPAGGTVPQTPRGVNVASGFEVWTLTGNVTYDPGSGELNMGTTGSALSPLMRIDGAASMSMGGDFYATNPSVNSGITPDASYHLASEYYAADGVTPAPNASPQGYVGNGCARAISRNSWSNNDTRCGFTGGPNVVYVRYRLYASSGGYASNGLIVRNPQLILN